MHVIEQVHISSFIISETSCAEIKLNKTENEYLVRNIERKQLIVLRNPKCIILLKAVTYSKCSEGKMENMFQ